MFNLLLFAIALLQASTLASPTSCVNGISQRKEYRDISKQDWFQFRDALMKLQAKPSKDGANYTEWDRITHIHITSGHKYHGTRLFLHWHRTFTAAFETALKEINPRVSLPYWNYSHDWQAADKSLIMTPEYGLDVKLNGTTGDCRYQRHFQTPHCLKRDYKPDNFPKLPSDEYVNLVLDQVKDFGRFSEFVEKSIHNPVHIAISGDMNQQEAPNDPIFWLFHAYVDKIWADWQSKQPSGLNATEAKTVLEPFGVTAEQVESIQNLCYTYKPFSKERSFAPRMMVTASK